ncbi:hypothetical protein CGCF415_v015511 [Colletotrichum fructicola]|uniref:Uncharacterized protein n=1 Tax=Colletotrichum fructicola (strain Nara gc5) TaxID=1213859 RepID=A0A7J6IGQ0_COLFN|nr:uncharacterized protein CGMCC3_g6102 [Colletotrichum fructicola]KAF4475171.1 hypothetical protein CGGC5_v015794 [Colletotrichum fructicola Nara gc5]KAE9577634.1 hypothetical protein CGMCC3_g6102 [Colletotrichum fructicola]KAF4419627.1 hypothetical protein CFRS1_v005549 [Colletotrichum fructicola]KAF4884925.1 hypothetical protein CGCFRS4_v012348 [Colletotrichum fructicola]KAF4884943.1 hypothetical protein CGCF415_v015511 [Colletotrichum fructicola]
MRTHFNDVLFHLQSSDALAILFLSTQEKRHSWASTITVSGLMLWICISFVLLLEFRGYLAERAPWSVIAIAGPVSIWAAIVSVKGIEFYYAGLFTPIWIASGLNILAVYDSKNRTKFRKQMKKDKIDLESGPRHVTGSESTSAICGPLRAAQALSMTIVDSR